MSSVPSLTAHASSILALAMFRASWIARFLITFRASPIIVAPENPYFLQPLKIQFQFSRNNCNITMKFLQWNQTSNHIENKAVKLRFNLSLKFKDIKIAFPRFFQRLIHVLFPLKKSESSFKRLQHAIQDNIPKVSWTIPIGRDALSFISQMQNWFPPRGILEERRERTRVPPSSELVIRGWELFALADALSPGKRRGRERRQL